MSWWQVMLAFVGMVALAAAIKIVADRLWPDGPREMPQRNPISPGYVEGGIPERIEVLSPRPEMNRPYGSDTYSHNIFDDHLRTCYAYIAQLRDRIEKLEGKQ